VSPVQLLLRIILILSIPALIAVGTYLFFRQAFLAPFDPSATKEVIIEIAPGKPFSEVSKALVEQQAIRYAWSLDILAKTSKADTKVKAGEYIVTAAMSPRMILDKLMSGDVIKRVVTVSPGMSIKELPAIVEAQGLMKADQFAAALKDPGLLIRAGIASQSFEGYLWPDTYQFSRPIVAWDIIFRMLEEGEKKWLPEFTARSEELRLSRHEVLTLASIIEKEAGNQEEMPVISSVFHNRLKQGMKLQADPTVIYGLENFNGDLRDEDMKNPHAYNTYVNLGLPPGPICAPGEGAIRAALYPSEMPYLFFVADGTGKHVFSTTYAEHQEAVKRYLQAIKNK
jgi:UPF0755 protein